MEIPNACCGVFVACCACYGEADPRCRQGHGEKDVVHVCLHGKVIRGNSGTSREGLRHRGTVVIACSAGSNGLRNADIQNHKRVQAV